MKKYLILTLTFFSFFFASCSSDDEPEIPLENRGRTVLVYLLAENSLDPYASDDVNEMLEGMKAVADKTCNLVVYLDDDDKPRLLHIYKDESSRVKMEVDHVYPEQLSNKKEVMNSVIKKVIHDYPSNNYGLVLWSHGEGWLPYPLNRSISFTRSWGQDGGDGGDFMNISDLRIALADAVTDTPKNKFDFIFFDSCFMSGVEVGYELRNLCDYLIGSVAEIPGPGAPYQNVTADMFTKNFNPSALCNSYFNYYKFTFKSNTLPTNEVWCAGSAISAIKMSELNGLAQATSKVLTNHTEELQDFNTDNLQFFDYARRRYPKLAYDFEDFIKNVASADEYSEWKSQLDRTVVYAATTPTVYSVYTRGLVPMTLHCGVSCYIPSPKMEYQYYNHFFSTYDWYEDSGWKAVGW